MKYRSCSLLARTCEMPSRSEEHTSELQSQSNLVCRLLLEKKNTPQGARVRPDAARLNAPATRATDALPPRPLAIRPLATVQLEAPTDAQLGHSQPGNERAD